MQMAKMFMNQGRRGSQRFNQFSTNKEVSHKNINFFNLPSQRMIPPVIIGREVVPKLAHVGMTSVIADAEFYEGPSTNKIDNEYHENGNK